MRVVVPFTYRHPEVEAGVRASLTSGACAVWEDVSADAHAYWRALARWWDSNAAHRLDDLVIVEHDVICRPDVIEQFEACPEPWCVFGYANLCHPECREAWANMLGCTRFRKELVDAVPWALSTIPPEQRDWHNLCDSMAGDKVGGMPAPLRPGSLRHAGFTHHWHEPPVQHYPWGVGGVPAALESIARCSV